MAAEITERMFKQLGKYFDRYLYDWCNITLELMDDKFLIFHGELYSNEDSILFKSIEGSELVLSFSNEINKPSLKLTDKNRICQTNIFKNLNIVIEFAGKTISNQWEPPKELLSSEETDMDFLIIDKSKSIFDDTLGNERKTNQMDTIFFEESFPNKDEMKLDELIYDGECARLSGSFDLAYSYFIKAIWLHPTNPEPHQKLGIAKIDNHDYKSALNDFNNAINFGGQHWSYFYDRGLIYYKLGEYDLSIADYLMALDLIDSEPEDKDRQFDMLLDRLVATQLKQENYKEAIETLSQLIELKTDKKWVAKQIFERAQAKRRIGLIEEAIDDFKLAVVNFQKWNGIKAREVQEIESIIIKMGGKLTE